MANYQTLKSAIQQVIKQNGNNEITGALLQQNLLAMINALGAGYQYMGIATPTTNPGTPDPNIFYIATTPGSYANFSSIVVSGGEFAILKYNGQWSKETLPNDYLFSFNPGNGYEGYTQRINGYLVLYENQIAQIKPYNGYCVRIPLIKNTKYYVLKPSGSSYPAYSITLGDGGKNIIPGYFAIGGGTVSIGSGMTIESGKITFTTPNQDGLYLYANLVFGAMDLTKSFFVTTNSTMTQGQIFLFDDFNLYSMAKGIVLLNDLPIGKIETDIKNLQTSISGLKPDNIYDGFSQELPGYLVLRSDTNVYNVGSFSGGRMARIPLTKNTQYYLPATGNIGGAYNMIVADKDFNKIANYYCGNRNTEIGSALSIANGKITFTSPNQDGLYLYVNLVFAASNTNMLLDFYLTTNSNFAGKQNFQIENINLEAVKNLIIKHTETINNFGVRITALENQSTNPYGDKVLYVLGDSITWLNISSTPNRGWLTHFLQRLTFASHKNYAYSGATLSNYSDSSVNISGYWGSPDKDNIVFNQVKRMINDIQNNNMPVPDYIIIAAGCNDTYMFNTTSSSFAERHAQISHLLDDTAKDIFEAGNDTTSYYTTKTPAQCNTLAKALRLIGDAIISVCPHAQVIITTPLQSAYFTESQQKQVSQLIEDCAEYLSWNVINQGKDGGISRLQESKGYVMTYDGTHTSELGAEYLGGFLAARVKSIFRK